MSTLTTKQHLLRLAALLAWAIAVQAWTIGRSVSPSQDAVRFIATAQAMQAQGLRAVAARSADEPLYPALLSAAERVLRCLGDVGPQRWVRAAQGTAAAACVLTVVPVYLLLLALVPPGAAWLGTLFFASASQSARLGADALSDPLYLLLAAASLCLAVRCAVAPRCGRTAAGLVLCGAVAAAALAAHRAAWLLAVAVPAGWVASCLGTRPGQLRRAAAGLVSMVSGWLAIAAAVGWGVYGHAAAGTPSASVHNPGGATVAAPGDRQATPHTGLVAWSIPAAGDVVLPPGELGALSAEAFAKKEPQTSLRFSGWSAAVVKYLDELLQVLCHGPALLVLAGLWAARRSSADHGEPAEPAWRAAHRFAAGAFAAYSLGLVVAAQWLGYLAGRHLLPLAMLAMGYAGHGTLALAAMPRWPHAARRHVLVAVVAVAMVCCLARLIPPLHENRRPHRAAGQWLAVHAPPQCAVVDTRGFTALYSGRTTWPYYAGWPALLDRRTAFVVVERHELQHDSPRSHALRWLLETAGELAAEFSPDGHDRSARSLGAGGAAWDSAHAEHAGPSCAATSASHGAQQASDRCGKNVCIYRWHPERLATPTRGAQRPGG